MYIQCNINKRNRILPQLSFYVLIKHVKEVIEQTLHDTYRLILNMCNINIFVMVLLY